MLLKKLTVFLLPLFLFFCSGAQNKSTLFSPDKNLQLSFWLNDAGVPMYELNYKNKPVVLPSALGFEIKENFSSQ